MTQVSNLPEYKAHGRRRPGRKGAGCLNQKQRDLRQKAQTDSCLRNIRSRALRPKKRRRHWLRFRPASRSWKPQEALSQQKDTQALKQMEAAKKPSEWPGGYPEQLKSWDCPTVQCRKARKKWKPSRRSGLQARMEALQKEVARVNTTKEMQNLSQFRRPEKS